MDYYNRKEKLCKKIKALVDKLNTKEGLEVPFNHILIEFQTEFGVGSKTILNLLQPFIEMKQIRVRDGKIFGMFDYVGQTNQEANQDD